MVKEVKRFIVDDGNAVNSDMERSERCLLEIYS